MIREAGGIAVLAHPATLDPSLRSIPSLLKNLQKVGLGGVEVYYPSHSQKAVKALLKMADDLNLLSTGGSDYHNSERSSNNMNEWLNKTNIPYSLVIALKGMGHS